MNKKFYIVIGTLLLMLNLVVIANADTFVVTNTADTNNGICISTNCSLREAVAAINASPNSAVNNILFQIPSNDPNCSQQTKFCIITLGSEIVISSIGPVVINGAGLNHLIIKMGGTDRIFRSFVTLTLKDMILSFGQGRGSASSVNGKGSAIFFDGNNGGSLTLDKVTVQYNDSTTLTGSSGSVYLFGGTNHRFSNSTFNGNRSGNCGAFQTDNTTLTVINSTIINNTVFGFGGGACVSSGTTRIISSTIGNNTAGTGGGIAHINGTLELGSTIVAGNTGSGFPDFRQFNGTITTLGGNFIGINSGVETIFSVGDHPNFDRVGDSTSPVNAFFAPLGFYGGTTWTAPLSNGSPAIDHGIPIFGENQLFDQRGVARLTIDSGAYEVASSFVVFYQFITVNRLYRQVITDNNNGYTYCISSGSLPPGLSGIPDCSTPLNEGEKSFSPQAVVAITGTPTMPGTFDFTITTTNGTNTLTTNYQIPVVAPTAANVSVGGHTRTSVGSGIGNAEITLTDQAGVTRRTHSSSVGYFRFDDVQAGQIYVISIRSKKYQFTNSAEIVNVNDEITNLDFTALPQ